MLGGAKLGYLTGPQAVACELSLTIKVFLRFKSEYD